MIVPLLNYLNKNKLSILLLFIVGFNVYQMYFKSINANDSYDKLLLNVKDTVSNEKFIRRSHRNNESLFESYLARIENLEKTVNQLQNQIQLFDSYVYDKSSVHFILLENVEHSVDGKTWVKACEFDHCRTNDNLSNVIFLMQEYKNINPDKKINIVQIGYCNTKLYKKAIEKSFDNYNYEIVDAFQKNEPSFNKSCDLNMQKVNRLSVAKQLNKNVKLITENSIYETDKILTKYSEKSIDIFLLDTKDEYNHPILQQLLTGFLKKLQNDALVIGLNYGVNVPNNPTKVNYQEKVAVKTAVDKFRLKTLGQPKEIFVANNYLYYFYKRKPVISWST